MSISEKLPKGSHAEEELPPKSQPDSGFEGAPRDQPVRGLKPFSWFSIVFSLLAALFLFALDNTIVADVQANIIYTLGGIYKLPGISVAFALGAVTARGRLYCLLDNKLHIQRCPIRSWFGCVRCCTDTRCTHCWESTLWHWRNGYLPWDHEYGLCPNE